MSGSTALALSFQTTSVEEAEQFFTGSYAPVRLEPLGKMAVRLSAVACGGISSFTTHCPQGLIFHTTSAFDGYNLALPLTGACAVEVAGRPGPQARAGKGMVVDGLQVTRAAFSAELCYRGLSVEADLLHRNLFELSGQALSQRVVFAPEVSQGSGVVRLALELADLLDHGLAEGGPLHDAPIAVTNLRQAIVRLMLEGLPHSHSAWLQGQGTRPPLPAPRHVGRAMAFMAAHADWPITLADIAAAAGCSPRSLQAGFRRYRDSTPLSFLRQLRLSAARTDLVTPGREDAIATVARRWGFAHLGNFAMQYRAAFGELPSQTRQRHPAGRG